MSHEGPCFQLGPATAHPYWGFSRGWTGWLLLGTAFVSIKVWPPPLLTLPTACQICFSSQALLLLLRMGMGLPLSPCTTFHSVFWWLCHGFLSAKGPSAWDSTLKLRPLFEVFKPHAFVLFIEILRYVMLNGLNVIIKHSDLWCLRLIFWIAIAFIQNITHYLKEKTLWDQSPALWISV